MSKNEGEHILEIKKLKMGIIAKGKCYLMWSKFCKNNLPILIFICHLPKQFYQLALGGYLQKGKKSWCIIQIFTFFI